MPTLTLLDYQPKMRRIAHKVEIWDLVRKKFVALRPEEMVRQAMVQYLVVEKNYPLSLLNVERHLLYAQRIKRADIVAYSPEGKALLLVECKAPTVALSQEAIEQLCSYNFALQARYIALYNGNEIRIFELLYSTKAYQELAEVPAYCPFS